MEPRSSGRQGNSPPHFRHNSPRNFPAPAIDVATRRPLPRREHGLLPNPLMHSGGAAGDSRWSAALVAILVARGARRPRRCRSRPPARHRREPPHRSPTSAAGPGSCPRRPDRRLDPRDRHRAREVRQRFANRPRDCVEGVYVFPLPEGAAVDRMRLPVGERVIEAEIRERVEAKKIYEQAKADGKKASLLEQERPNVFTAVGRVDRPRRDRRDRDRVPGDPPLRRGKFHLRFPMVVAPRYVPGSPRRSPARQGTGWGINTTGSPTPPDLAAGPSCVRGTRANPVRLHGRARRGLPLRRLDSSTHAVGRRRSATAQLHRRDGGRRRRTATSSSRGSPTSASSRRAAVFTETLDGQIYALVMLVRPPADERRRAAACRGRRSSSSTRPARCTGLDRAGPARSFFALDRLRPGTASTSSSSTAG